MHILVDVDGVLAEQVLPVLKRIEEEYDVTMEKEDVKRWDEPVPGAETDIKIEIEKAVGEPEFILEMEPIEGAVEAMKILNRYHKITIATHRTNEVAEATKKWLREHSIKFDDFYSTAETEKHSIEADLLIDDYPGHIIKFTKNGNPTILFKQPWNRDAIEPETLESHPIYIAENWEEILEIVREIEVEESYL